MKKILYVAFGFCITTCSAQSAPTHRTELSLGGAYLRAAPGPSLSTANLAGFDLSITRFIIPRVGLTANVRGYFGNANLAQSASVTTQPTRTTTANPFVSEYTFVAGPQVRIVNRQRFHTGARALFGAVDGIFDSDLSGVAPATVGLYKDQTVFAGQFGGVIDFDVSRQVALRATPGLLLTRFDGSFKKSFNVGVAVVYRFGAR